MEFLRTVNRLDRTVMNDLPPIDFPGDIVVVTSPQEAERIAQELMREEMVGFDTESRPSFRRGVSYPVSLLQFSTLDRAFLIQLKTTGIPDAVTALMESDSVKKLGVGLRDDLTRLNAIHQFKPAGFVDLGLIAQSKGIIQVGARALTARYLGRKLVKSSQKTNWARPDLTEKQKRYAATDAWVCLHIYPKLLEDTTDYRELALAEEEQARLQQESATAAENSIVSENI